MFEYTNKIQANNIPMQNKSKLPQEVIDAEKNYRDFTEKINKSDFCNTSARYVGELVYVRRLQELYSENNCEELQAKMAERESVILDKLKTEFGISYKE